MSSRPTKRCPITGCTTVHLACYLMCPHHWGKVSRATQREVYRTWRAFQKGTLSEAPYAAAAAQAKKEAAR